MIGNDGMLKAGDICWFVGRENGILYKYEIQTKKIYSLVALESESDSRYRLFNQCVLHNNKLFIFPYYEKKIAIYDFLTEEVKYIALNSTASEHAVVTGVWEENNKIYFIAAGLQQIGSLSLNEYFISFQNIECNQKEHLAEEYYKEDGCVYLIYQNAPKITKYDFLEKKQRNYSFSTDIQGFGTINRCKNQIVLSGYNDCIYSWDSENNLLNELASIPAEFYKKNEDREGFPDFAKSFCMNQNMIFIPRNLSKIFQGIICYDIEKQAVKLIKITDKNECLNQIYKLEYRDDEKIVLCDYSGNDFIAMYIADWHKEELDYNIDIKSASKCFCFDTVHKEQWIGLEMYLKLIQNL